MRQADLNSDEWAYIVTKRTRYYYEGDGETSADEYEDYKQEYKSRLEDPHVGDDVEYYGAAQAGEFIVERRDASHDWVAADIPGVFKEPNERRGQRSATKSRSGNEAAHGTRAVEDGR